VWERVLPLLMGSSATPSITENVPVGFPLTADGRCSPSRVRSSEPTVVADRVARGTDEPTERTTWMRSMRMPRLSSRRSSGGCWLENKRGRPPRWSPAALGLALESLGCRTLWNLEPPYSPEGLIFQTQHGSLSWHSRSCKTRQGNPVSVGTQVKGTSHVVK
jgi:hypothetical protein